MPAREDGELHAWQVRSAVWDLVLQGRGRVQKKNSGKIEQDFKGFTVQNVIQTWIYLFIYF